MHEYPIDAFECQKKGNYVKSTIKTSKIKPYNDKEFCKRSKGRGPKSFAWSYDDDTV